ncbi:MAG: hypothetical protein V4527_00570 [Pseudomonadota bacterium]
MKIQSTKTLVIPRPSDEEIERIFIPFASAVDSLPFPYSHQKILAQISLGRFPATVRFAHDEGSYFRREDLVAFVNGQYADRAPLLAERFAERMMGASKVPK